MKYKRKAAYVPLNKFDKIANDGQFVEMTEWKNGLGYDVVISDPIGNRIIQLPVESLQAINHLFNKLEGNEN